MIRTAKMCQLTAVIPEKYFQKATSTLLELGQLDFISVKELHPTISGSLKTVESNISISYLRELRKKLESLLASGLIPLPTLIEENEKHTIDHIQLDDFDKIARQTQEIDESINGLRNKQKQLQQDYLAANQMISQLEHALKSKTKEQKNIYSSYLVVRSGKLLSDDENNILSLLKDLPCLLVKNGDGGYYQLVHLKKDIEKIDGLLTAQIWSGDDIQIGEEGINLNLLERAKDRERAVVQNQHRLKESIESSINDNKELLCQLWRKVKIGESYFAIQQRFNKTGKTFIFSGWIMEREKKKVSEAILKSCEGECYIEFMDAREAQVAGLSAPVKLETPTILKPFEKVITDFKTPAYGTLNPVYIVAFTFMVMFGMMFGDAGHGAVILLTSLVGMLLGKKNKKEQPLFNLLIWCGFSAIVFGVLFGSYFGYPLFKAIWFNYHGAVTGEHSYGPIGSIMQVLALCAWLGVGVITLGIVLHLYNAVCQKDFISFFCDKSGVAGLLVYGALVYIAYYFLKDKNFSKVTPLILLICFALPALLFLVKLIHHQVRSEKGFTFSSIFMVILELLIEFLELFSSYLANTLSFLRVAGLGIAHVSLMSAFFTLADMVKGSTTNVAVGLTGYWVLIVLGNILVCALEGLSAWIQTLRLHYYEFFNKFLVGGGIAYNPINIRGKGDA